MLITQFKKYNSTEHNTIQISPNDAKKSENHLWVKWHLQNNAKKGRKYKEIKEGDMVRVNIKKGKFAKGHEPNWSKERHKVVDVNAQCRTLFLYETVWSLLNCY